MLVTPESERVKLHCQIKEDVFFTLHNPSEMSVKNGGLVVFLSNSAFDALSFRIALQQSSLSGRLVLYHFVGPSSSSSASPILMIRRFTVQVQ